MRINTKADTLELTKAEENALDKASALAAQVAKHAGGPLQEAGKAAHEAMAKLIDIYRNGIPELNAVTPAAETKPLKAGS